MVVEKIPEAYIEETFDVKDLFFYDFRMTDDVVKTKVQLDAHMFSFLQVGIKHVHFADSFVKVDQTQSLLIKKGNCLWTELVNRGDVYCCKLFFFSDEYLLDFLEKHGSKRTVKQAPIPYWIIENDPYIMTFVKALDAVKVQNKVLRQKLYTVKLEELLLYLLDKYGDGFEAYLLSLVSTEHSKIKTVVEKNIYSGLKLEEIAFLCNMSLSTFKRSFEELYHTSPGKWLKNQRLEYAKNLLERKEKKASEIYLDIGYNNLSNFSAAFKKKFGLSPNQLLK